MENSQRVAVLAEMGIDWYVPNSFDASYLATNDIEPSAAVALVPEETAAEPPPVATEAIAHARAAVIDVVAAEPPVEADPKPELTAPPVEVPPVEPFHWLLAQADFVHFVCDIKQPRLAPVWHAAAQELLGDIAIALGAKAGVSNDYFSWPPSGQGDALSDADLPDFLAEYLDSGSDDALYILMGSAAETHASDAVLKGKTRVLTVPLGQLFRDHDHKKGLWQQLKPLRR